MNEAQIRIRIEEKADLEATQSCANEHQSIQIEATASSPNGDIESQMEPVTGVLIAAGTVTVAKFIMDWWEKRRGGLIIDMRPDAKDQVYRHQDIPYGFFLVFSADGGQVKIETRDMPKDATQQLLESVISGAYKTVLDLAKAARDTLPDADIQEVSTSNTA